MLWSLLLQKMIARMMCDKTVCPDSEGGNGEKSGLREEQDGSSWVGDRYGDLKTCICCCSCGEEQGKATS